MVPLRIACIVLLLATACLGCEEGLGPSPVPERPFTLYGQLNARADTQAVIVIPIQDRLAPLPPEPLDAQVTSTDLTTGGVQVWRDSLVQMPEGDVRHVFWAPFRAVYEHQYGLTVARSDGAETFVGLTMPPEANVARLMPVLPFGNQVRLPIQVSAVPTLLQPTVTYVLSVPGEVNPVVFSVSYEDEEQGGFFEIDLTEDARAMHTTYGSGIRLIEIELTFFVAGIDWTSPFDGFEPDVLIQAGVFSNVQNGFGFVGGGYPVSERWTPADSLLERVGLN